jgi:uncharacterized membrane protein YeiH
MKEWFSGRGADEPPPEPPVQRPTVLAWKLYAAIAVLSVAAVIALSSCASRCEQSEEIVTVLAANETHVIQLRGRVELCPR